EASFQVLERWSLGVNASYADGKIRNGTIACNASTYPVGVAPSLAQIQAAAGAGETLAICSGVNQPVTTTPKFSANVQSEYGFGLGSNADAFVRGLATIAGKTQGDPNNAFDSVGSYALVNLYTGVRD